MIERMFLTPKEFSEILQKYNRVAITGAVNSGKSLLLDESVLDRKSLHTDDLHRRGLTFPEYPEAVLLELKGEDRFIATGMQIPRILRKGLEVDVVIWIDQPRTTLTKRQNAFSKGARTILTKWAETTNTPVYKYQFALHKHEAAEKLSALPLEILKKVLYER